MSNELKIGARRYAFTEGDVIEEDMVFVDAEAYESLRAELEQAKDEIKMLQRHVDGFDAYALALVTNHDEKLAAEKSRSAKLVEALEKYADVNFDGETDLAKEVIAEYAKGKV